MNPTGATVTALVIRIRAGIGLAGAILATFTHGIGAAATGSIPFDFYDDAAGGAGGYTVTGQQTGGSSNGTANLSLTVDPV